MTNAAGAGDPVNIDGSNPAANVAVRKIGSRVRARRPNGSASTMLGWVLMLGGLGSFFVGLFSPEVSYPYGSTALPPEPNLWKWPAMLGGGAVFQLGLGLWAVGQVVQAIFFLPGRTVKSGELEIAEALAAEAEA